MEEIEFKKGSVPVSLAATLYGKDACWVRAGIISGGLPIGTATRKGKLITKVEDINSKYGRINFYISPKKLWEETGYLWKGERTMGTTIRPSLSKKNKYWIEKHRYYELKHFCLQYEIWMKAYLSLDGLSKRPEDLSKFSKSNSESDPTALCAIAKQYYSDRMNVIEMAALKTDAQLSPFILKAVTRGLSYNHLKAKHNIPCGKDVYYELYHKFFWILNKDRD